MSSSSLFEDLTYELVNDPDRDVADEAGSLVVAGKKFAYLDGDLLVALLPSARAEDLIVRGIATASEAESPTGGRWIRIADSEDWSELAREAHDFTRGHPVGGQS